MKIKSITDLKLQNSFYQLNLIKGFKYIDKAGEIVNLYYEGNKPPNFNMGIDGLYLKSPEEYIEVLKYSSDRLWMKFDKISTIDQVIQFIGKPINITKDIQKVEIISRIGWRNIFLIELVNTQEVNNIENIVEIIPDTNTLSFRITHSKNEIKSVIEIELLVNKKDKNKKALQINVDVFIQENIKIDDVAKRTKEIMQYFKNDFIKLINQLLREK
ncbi:hypothetical protein ES705_31163 [subsurface metagenome]